MTAQRPAQVVRFYGNTNYALECVALRQITFIHREKLNDPFDVLDTYFDDYETMIHDIHQRYPARVSEFLSYFPKKEDMLTTRNAARSSNQKLSNETFIFSTCEVLPKGHPRDNLYMWSHYGNGHRGVAIEFDTAILENFLKNEPENKDVNEDPWFKIDYVDDIPKVTGADMLRMFEGSDTTLESIIRRQARLKGKIWKPENEWRLMQHNNETRMKTHKKGPIPREAITSVYFGCRLPESERKDLIFEAKRNFPEVRTFQAKAREGAFALDFDETI